MLKPDAMDFYEMTIDDFEIVDYEPVQPQLKLELGI
jgi:thymidylate synthase